VTALDPVPALRARLLQSGVLTDTEAGGIEAQAEEVVDAAVTFADTSPDPTPDALFAHAYAAAVTNAPHQVPGDPVVSIR